MSDDAAARLGSGADLARRLEHLEQAHSDLASQVGTLTISVQRIELNQSHANEVTRLRLDKIETAVNTLAQKFDAAVAEGQRMMLLGLEGTPTGKLVKEQLDDLRHGRQANAKAIDKLGQRVAYFNGGLAVLTMLVVLFGPTIRHALGLP